MDKKEITKYENKVFCPYRICPLGAHVDHQFGMVTGFAIDRGITLYYNATKDGQVACTSLNFDGLTKFNVREAYEKQYAWGDMIQGAAYILSTKYKLSCGFEGVIEGTMPIGGLSSSAACIIVYLSALADVNHIHLTRQQIINYAIRVEREYIGVNVGKLDQSCEVYCKKNHILFLDTLDDTTELIPVSPDMAPFKIAIIYSGVSRKLAGSAYNLRVDECKAAAYALKDYSGMDYGKFTDTYLREVPRAVYDAYKSSLPPTWRKRAHHYYHEQDRVHKGIEAWRNGDIKTFGQMIFESGASSIYHYEAGSAPLKALYEIMKRTDGIYGGRFSGAGFNGCCMAIIEPEKEQSIIEYITAEYAKIFPEYMKDFEIVICDTADGIEMA